MLGRSAKKTYSSNLFLELCSSRASSALWRPSECVHSSKMALGLLAPAVVGVGSGWRACVWAVVGVRGGETRLRLYTFTKF